MSDYDEYYEEELRDRYQSDADEIYYSDNSDADAFYPYRSHVFKCYDRVERSTLPLPPLPVEALQLVFGFALDDARPRYRARMCTSYSRVCRLWRKSMNKQCAKIMVARSHYCEKLVERLDERKYGVKGLRVPIKEVELLVEHHSYGGRGARYTKLLKNPMLRGLKSLKITLGSKMAMESLAAPVVTAMSKLHELERFELVPEFGRARQGDWHTGDESCTWKAPGFWDITEERLETLLNSWPNLREFIVPGISVPTAGDPKLAWQLKTIQASPVILYRSLPRSASTLRVLKVTNISTADHRQRALLKILAGVKATNITEFGIHHALPQTGKHVASDFLHSTLASFVNVRSLFLYASAFDPATLLDTLAVDFPSYSVSPSGSTFP